LVRAAVTTADGWWWRAIRLTVAGNDKSQNGYRVCEGCLDCRWRGGPRAHQDSIAQRRRALIAKSTGGVFRTLPIHKRDGVRAAHRDKIFYSSGPAANSGTEEEATKRPPCAPPESSGGKTQGLLSKRRAQELRPAWGRRPTDHGLRRVVAGRSSDIPMAGWRFEAPRDAG